MRVRARLFTCLLRFRLHGRMGCPIRHMLPWFLRNKVPPSGKHGPSSPVWNLSQSQPKRTLLAAFCVLYPGQWEKPRKRPEIKNLNKYVSDGFSPPFWLEGCDGAESDGVLAVIGQLDAVSPLLTFPGSSTSTIAAQPPSSPPAWCVRSCGF